MALTRLDDADWPRTWTIRRVITAVACARCDSVIFPGRVRYRSEGNQHDALSVCGACYRQITR